MVRTKKVERQYASQLRKIAHNIGRLVDSIYSDDTQPPDLMTADRITRALERYAQTLIPWATAVGGRMVAEIDARDRDAWRDVSKQMAMIHRNQLENTHVGNITRQRLIDQIDLITSLPREAGERVQKLTWEGLTNATRAKTIAREIARSGEVSESRAMLIARTEVSRTSTEFTRARAENIGSTHFVWRTAGDHDVRPTHRALNGRTFAWNDPPECDPGHHALPGCIWNCRCYAEPVV